MKGLPWWMKGLPREKEILDPGAAWFVIFATIFIKFVPIWHDAWEKWYDGTFVMTIG